MPINLGKIDSDHDLLKAFHNYLYGVVGKKSFRKKNIRRSVCQSVTQSILVASAHRYTRSEARTSRKCLIYDRYCNELLA